MALKYKEGDYIWDINHNDIFAKISRIYIDYDRKLRVEVDDNFTEVVSFSYEFIDSHPDLRPATKLEVLLYARK